MEQQGVDRRPSLPEDFQREHGNSVGCARTAPASPALLGVAQASKADVGRRAFGRVGVLVLLFESATLRIAVEQRRQSRGLFVVQPARRRASARLTRRACYTGSDTIYRDRVLILVPGKAVNMLHGALPVL